MRFPAVTGSHPVNNIAAAVIIERFFMPDYFFPDGFDKFVSLEEDRADSSSATYIIHLRFRPLSSTRLTRAIARCSPLSVFSFSPILPQAFDTAWTPMPPA